MKIELAPETSDKTYQLTQIRPDYIRLDNVYKEGVLICFEKYHPKIKQLYTFFSKYPLGEFFDIT